MTVKTKTFDAVEMKRAAALRIHEQLKNKSIAEQIAYWRQRNEEFDKEVKSLQSDSKSSIPEQS